MDLFENDLLVNISDGAYLLRGFALQAEVQTLTDLRHILKHSALRHMVTPGGFTMSVAMTNCGDLGWVSDRKGYRYSGLNPVTAEPWQAMPASFLTLASAAAHAAGFANFIPDACLINQYKNAAKMSLHQDKDEKDFGQPIVSVSLGASATFLFGGQKRSDKPTKILLQHGDVVVWGGKSRLNYHGIMPLRAAHTQTNGLAAFAPCRFNLTFRKAV